MLVCTAFPQRFMNNPISFWVTDYKIEICFLWAHFHYDIFLISFHSGSLIFIGLGHQIWCFENESTFKNAIGCIPFLAMESKSRNQKGTWNCWLCFSPAPIFLPNSWPYLNQGGLDTKFELLKINAHLKNVVSCIPFLPWRLKVEIKIYMKFLTML